MKTSALFLLLPFIFSSCKPSSYELRSPDKNITVKIFQIDSKLMYQVCLHDTLILDESPLGIALKGAGLDFLSGLRITRSQKVLVRDSFTLTTGKRRQNIYEANQMMFSVKNISGNTLRFELHVANDGVAFRYILPNTETDTVAEEISGFSIPSGSITWAMSHRGDNEGYYTRRLTDTMNMAIYAMPMLVQTPSGAFILLHEADVLHRYAACSLAKKGSNELFSIVLQYPDYKHFGSDFENTFEAILENEKSEIIAEPGLKTPWRVMVIGRNLKPVIETTLIEALCPPPPAGDYSWVQPGVAVFPWWGNNLANGDTNALKTYIDLAAAMNWKFIEFDVSLIGSGGYAVGQWRNTPWIKNIVDYAASKNVLVYGWDERRNLDTPEKRADIFGRYRDYGIRGIKIDFINSTKQEAMAFREACLQDAMKYQLMVSFHGDYPPRGERRTYPNIATQEGVKGAEYYLFAPDNDVPTPEHNCTLPFTRNVVGPMDYTPVAFSHPRRITTYAHELALSVVVESGWLCMCDKPEFYLKSPAADFLKKLESVWDETLFLDGYPGEFFCIARRSGNNWFVAGINADDERTVHLNLDFLSKEIPGVWLYIDGENARGTCEVTEVTCAPSKPLPVTMAQNGGFAMIIKTKP